MLFAEAHTRTVGSAQAAPLSPHIQHNDDTTELHTGLRDSARRAYVGLPSQPL